MDGQDWRAHPDCTGLRFYDDGRVRSYRNGQSGVEVGIGNGRPKSRRLWRDDGSRGSLPLLMYEAWYGRVPEGLIILHHCEMLPYPWRDAPFNLNMGTDYDNHLDCVQKGRHPGVGGGRKLTDDQADAIYSLGPFNIPQAKAIAQDLPCGFRSVYRISRGESYVRRRDGR